MPGEALLICPPCARAVLRRCAARQPLAAARPCGPSVALLCVLKSGLCRVRNKKGFRAGPTSSGSAFQRALTLSLPK